MSRLHSHADIAGATASTVCLIHCLLTPIAISFFPAIVPYLPGDASFHRLLAVGIVLLGLAGFIPGFLLHRRKSLFLLIAIGMSLILTVACAGSTLREGGELTLSISGSLLLVTAHLLNRSFCRQCRACSDAAQPCGTTHIQPPA